MDWVGAVAVGARVGCDGGALVGVGEVAQAERNNERKSREKESFNWKGLISNFIFKENSVIQCNVPTSPETSPPRLA